MQTTRIDQLQAPEDRSPYFIGKVQNQVLVGPEKSKELQASAMFFSTGARTRPHIHQTDQVLHFVQGDGIVATETENYFASPGDVVTIPAGVWHWHGARRDSTACHISIRKPGPSNWDVDAKNWATNHE
jgi:quercetin dioxygenase-like cupin family protein